MLPPVLSPTPFTPGPTTVAAYPLKPKYIGALFPNNKY